MNRWIRVVVAVSIAVVSAAFLFSAALATGSRGAYACAGPEGGVSGDWCAPSVHSP